MHLEPKEQQNVVLQQSPGVKLHLSETRNQIKYTELVPSVERI